MPIEVIINGKENHKYTLRGDSDDKILNCLVAICQKYKERGTIYDADVDRNEVNVEFPSLTEVRETAKRESRRVMSEKEIEYYCSFLEEFFKRKGMHEDVDYVFDIENNSKKERIGVGCGIAEDEDDDSLGIDRYMYNLADVEDFILTRWPKTKQSTLDSICAKVTKKMAGYPNARG